MQLKRIQTGIGLLELMLSFAIIAALLLMAVRYYGSVNDNQKVTQAVQMVRDIYKAEQDYIQSNGSVGDIADLQAASLLSSLYDTNPWIGSFDISQQGNFFSLTITDIPILLCPRLKGRLETTIDSNAKESISFCPPGKIKKRKKSKLTVKYLLY